MKISQLLNDIDIPAYEELESIWEVKEHDDDDIHSHTNENSDDDSWSSTEEEATYQEHSLDSENETSDLSKLTEEILSFKCSCKGTNCIDKFKYDQVALHKCIFRFRDKNISRAYKRNYIAGLIQSNITTNSSPFFGDNVCNNQKRRRGSNIRQHIQYIVNGYTICKSSFLFIFNIGTTFLNNVAKDIKNNGCGLFVPSYNGAIKGRGKKDSLVLKFLKKYAELYAYPSPSTRRKKKHTLFYLPPGTSKKEIYNTFLESGNNDLNERENYDIGYDYFIQIWIKHFERLKILRFGSDYCDTCTFHYNQMKDNPQMKEEIQMILQLHKDTAAQERIYYYNECKANNKVHMSFDFAQSIHIPHFVRQPGILITLNG